MKITICGSISQVKKLVEIYRELEKLGHQPQMHEKMFAIAKGELDECPEGIEHADVKRKNNYIKWWHDLIVSGDAIVVGNFDKKGIKNYIGANTFLEIGFAHVSDKKIFLYNQIPEEVPYVDEIKAMVNVVLDGDLARIN